MLIGLTAQSEPLRIESFDAFGSLVFHSVPDGIDYQVEQAPSLSSVWTNAELPIVWGNGTATCVVPVQASSMFYRVTAVVQGAPDGMAAVPSGTLAGTNALFNGESYSESYPSNYSLTVDGFYIDQTEVTFQMWQQVYAWAVTNGYRFDSEGRGKAADHPVYDINWYDAVKWCNARSEQAGLAACYRVDGTVYRSGQQNPVCDPAAGGFRLPTQQEWEAAARGGQQSLMFPTGSSLSHASANFFGLAGDAGYHPDYSDETFPYTNPVDAFSPNACGLYGMAGNVWEWCGDAVGTNRMIRGGSWDAYSGYARCGYRAEVSPRNRDYDLGFRSARSRL